MVGLAVACVAGGQCVGSRVLAAEQKPLVFLADDNYPPLSYLDDGVAKGIDVDVAQALSSVLRREIRVELMDWRAAQERVLRGDADGLLSMSMTKERAASYDFSDAMATHAYGIFVKKGNSTIRDARDLTDRSVAVTRGGLPKQILGTRPGIRIVAVRDYLDGFAQLSAGSIDALAGDTQVAAYTIESHHLRDIIGAGTAFATLADGIAVKKGNAALVEEINAAVRTISANGTLADIQERWRPNEMVFVSRQRLNRLLLLSGGAVLVLLSAAMAAWVMSLKRQIRAQRAAESALERASLLAQALRSASDCITITDTTDHILYVNQAFVSTYGFEERELLGQHIGIVRSTTNDPGLVSGILSATTQQGGWRGVVWNQSKEGRVFPVSLVTSVVTDESGRIVGAIGVARDTSKELAAEAALRASEEKFFKIFQASRDCVAIVDFDSGQVLEVNDRVEQISGYTRSEVMGRPISDLGPFVDPAYRDIIASTLAETGCIRDFEYNLRHRDGQARTILWSADAIEVGGWPCHVSIHRDVTNQRAAEQALRLAESKYRLVVENANDIIFTVDCEGYYLAMNRAGREISGQAPDEPRGISLHDLVVPEQAGEAWRKLHAVLAGESVPTFELDVMTDRGSRRTLELDVRAIQGVDASTGIQGIARDVTKRKELEAQLRQAQKMEAIGRLAGGIAHDFNNLLTVILGYTSLVARRLDADNPMREDLEEIHRAARSAESLTSQLLIFSRKSVVNPTVLDFNEIVRRLHKMLSRVVGKDIEFIVRTRGDGALVLADGGQMEQVVMNLVVNARDAMPTGGTLTVETDLVSIDESFAHTHPGCTAGSYVRLTVTDTGSGMTKDTLERIFTPFFTTKGPTKGTGLGLATVHGIVQQAGGYISVESEPGRGAVFAIYLPLTKAVSQSVATIDTVDSYEAAGTILLVEDDESIRTLGARTLRQLGYSVLAARHATEALTLAERHGGNIDLLFTDLVMPGLNGRGLAERLTQSRTNLKVLYTSGFVGDEIRVHDVEAAGDFMQKPYTPESLARAVREILERSAATPGARSTPRELVS